MTLARRQGDERYNLGQQPMAFAQNPAVKALLEKEGAESLPLIPWDGFRPGITNETRAWPTS